MELNMKAANNSQEESSFRMLDTAPSTVPESYTQQHERRVPTDRAYLVLFILCVVLLLPLLIYALQYSDVNRYKGYDTCGNICDQKNIQYEKWNCSGQDNTAKLFQPHSKKCENSPLDYIVFSILMRHQISAFPWESLKYLMLASAGIFGLHIILILLFRFTTLGVVYLTLLVSCMYYSHLPVLILWEISESYRYTFMCIIIITNIIILGTVIFNRNQIRMFTTLLTAAAKAIFDMKSIVFVEISALTITVAILIGFCVSDFYVETSGVLTEVDGGVLDYVSDGYMKTGIVLNVIVALWAIQFIISIEFMTVSGAVFQWYYYRTNTTAKNAVLTSFCLVLRNHLGTAAIGSLLITVVTPVRFAVKCLSQISVIKGLADYLLIYLDGFFSDNIYILTGIYGTSYIESGNRVVTFTTSNIGKTRVINSFANFMIVSSQVLIILLSCWPTAVFLMLGFIFIMRRVDYVILFVCGFSYICGQVILGAVKVAANTIFFCAHQDCLVDHDRDDELHTENKFEKGPNLLVNKIKEKCL